MNISDILVDNLPTLDLHGLTSGEALIKLRGFIDEQSALKTEKIVVIHGIGKGIIKEVVIKEIKENKKIKTYKPHVFNEGVTVIILNQNRS